LNKTLKIIKNKEKPVQKYRFIIQILFALICIWIGVEFFLFTTFLESGGTTTFFERPPGAEAFLPVSAMMSVYYFILTGDIHNAHPAGFFIFIAIIAVSLLVGKSFCSWMCPVGFLSELVGDFGEKVQKKIIQA
jgi:polyferredoxin